MELIDKTRAEILERVPEYYFGDGEEFEQYHAIEQSLRQRGQSLIVVEMGRAAPLGDWFASLGETPAYRGGLSLANTNDLIALFQATDEKAAIETIRGTFDVDWVLMIDEYPMIDKVSDKPIPAVDVRFVVYTPSGERMSTKSMMGGHPDVLQPRIAKAGMV